MLWTEPGSGSVYFSNMNDDKNQFTPITDCRQIDPTRHGLIEASAGTGKTYTIENMVVRFLKERDDLSLSNILLVTFTEKATCELKIRIREKLEKELSRLPGEQAVKIKNALDAFDSASIFTIHGFCRSVLKDYAFENQALFQWELADDSALKESLIKEQIRKTWPAEYGDRIRDILEISDFISQKDKFISRIMKLEGSFRPEVGDRLLPESCTLPFSEIKEKLKEIRRLVFELKSMASEKNSFCNGFSKLNVNARTRKSIEDRLIIPLENCLLNMNENHFTHVPLLKILDFYCSTGREYLDLKYLKKRANPEACPQWETVKWLLAQLSHLYLELKNVLVVQSVYRLRKDLRREKLKRGLITYDDMLLQVKAALYSEQGRNLAENLREKYKVAFVDEFQDTDPVQWQIFRKLFLETDPKKDSNNLLYLIGDPKQAIYAFRGADVFAYLEAKNEMERLAASGKAVCYCLVTNWRSEPDLIRIYNELFSFQKWFKPPELCHDFEIGYIPVKAPGEKDRIFSMEADKTDRRALTIVDLSRAARPKTAKPILAKFIAREIDHLVNNGGFRRIEKDGSRKKISYGDICILVST